MSANRIIMILVFTILSGFIIYFLFFHRPQLHIVQIKINQQNFDLEVSKTIQQHTVGLMNRQSLCPSCGMIFVFGLELPQSFWMKNTLIPLDIIFLDKNGMVINITQGTPKSLELIPSDKPAKYVIELNAGASAKIHLKPGDVINLDNLLKSPN